jgi:RNA polymerase sigma-70 factor (ECF subfamily)
MKQDDANEGRSEVLDLEHRGWLPRYCRGDREAFGQLMRHYRSLIYTFLYRYGIDSQNRDDLFQEIFLKIHLAAPRYRPNQPLRPWLVSIALNTVRNHRRNEGRRWRFIKQLPQEPEAHEPGTDEIAEQQATVLWMESRIGKLPDAQREILMLTTIKGLRMKDVAAMLKMPESTVKTHLRRARLTLAEELVQRDSVDAEISNPEVAKIGR